MQILDEYYSVLQYFLVRKTLYPQDVAQSSNLGECYRLLNLTSRSFAKVIKELNPQIRDCIMLFYLILRALDTVEDDMTIDQAKVKVPLLRSFHEKLDIKGWSFNGNGPDEKDRLVLVRFNVILEEFHKLSRDSQLIIKQITKRMGNGMADYIENKDFNSHGILTVSDYDLYCHYVAGLVGDGLTQLIILNGYGSKDLLLPSKPQDITENKESLIRFIKESPYENMGLFLQKTNIIRDYNEDLIDGRVFWPKEIWSLYADDLQDFLQDAHTDKGVQCINHLILNALEHVEFVIQYLSMINEQTTFQFCVIPQVMAIATLNLLTNNAKVLHENVKLKKRTTIRLILESRTFKGTLALFRENLLQIKDKIPVADPNYLKFNLKIGKLDQFLEFYLQDHMPQGMLPQENEYYNKALARFNCDSIVQSNFIDIERKNLNRILLTPLILLLAVIYRFYR